MAIRKRVMVGMSGGVDSSVAALLLKEQGYDVVGATMCFSISGGLSRKPSCCGIEGIEDAKRVAQQIGIPHYVLDFKDALEEIVVLDFIVEYISGRTPNPCMRCNQYLKFGTMLEKARALGINLVATGHFARIEKEDKEFLLKKGIDKKKDQSYFLSQVKPRELSHILFPLGEMTKDEVRAIAKKRGLCVADKPASQEICFITNNDYRAFLKGRLNKAYFKQGDIVDKQGKVLGHHNGIFNFTIGQREGLGVSAPYPFYVIKLDEEGNRVIVGKKEDTYTKGLIATEPVIFVKTALNKSVSVQAKIRYNSPEQSVKVSFLNKNKLKVDFAQPQSAVTPGQFVVFYKDDVVLGGAKIIESI